MTVFARITLRLLLCASADSALANSLHRLDLMTDGRSDRVVFEFDHRATYKMSSPAADVVEIAFSDVELSSEFLLPDMPSGLNVIQHMTPRKDEKGKLVVTIHLQREAEPTGITLSATPWKYAMDLSPKITDGEQAKPRYIPGDRPFHTKYTQKDPESPDSLRGVRLSRLSLIILLIFAFAAGVLSIFGLGHALQRPRRRVGSIPKVNQPTSSSRDTFHFELERDLSRLKRTVEREHSEPWSALSLMEERQKLILKLMQEGQDLNAIARALDMSPDQIRKILDNQS